MGRDKTSLKHYEAVSTCEIPEDIITCIDFHTRPNGNLGSTTKHLRGVDTCHPMMVEPVFDHLNPLPLPTEEALPEQDCLPADVGLTMDDMLPVDPAYLEEVNEVSSPEPAKEKRSTYTPLPHWLLHRDRFLTELLRLEGRGDYINTPCPSCGAAEALYRCKQCSGGALLCQACIISRHSQTPLHVVEKWTDDLYFERVTLKTLGLTVQLGHRFSEECPTSKRPHGGEFIVMDLNGIHAVNLRFCDCLHSESHFVQLLRYGWYPASIDRPQTAATMEALKFFHILNFESKVSMFEFYRTLVRLTDNTGVHLPKDRYPAFVVIIREYRNLKALKRGGRGHKQGGAAQTQKGELAVLCPACPQPNINMSPGWELASKENRFLHGLFLAIDANFRLKRRNITNERKDLSLSDGWSYFVPQAEYQEHLKAYSDLIKQPKSTCSNHQAVNAERAAKGYAVTGVSTVDCARHDMKRPLAVGDLDRGERFVNTDFMYFLSLKGSILKDIVSSYDIGCQWDKNIWKRNDQYPADMSISPERRSRFRFLVPKFHLPSHKEKCQTRYSFNFAPWVGRTDGEAPERGWSRINPIAPSSSEMNSGNRHETLDDHFGDSNWRKTADIALLLNRRLLEAKQDADDYRFVHNQFTLGLSSHQRRKYERALKAWMNDPSKPNPFEKRFSVITEKQVRRRLELEEEEEVKRGRGWILHEKISAVAMITMGLDLEAEQQKLAAKEAQVSDSDDTQPSRIKSSAIILRRKIQAWIGIQQLYAPFLCAIRDRDAAAHPSAQAETPATKIKLYLPSSIAESSRIMGYDRRLVVMEYQLRCAQADDALDQLRNALRLRTFVYIDKREFSQGQKHQTRSLGMIARINAKVSLATTRYRSACDAISHLAPILDKPIGVYPILNDSDIRGYNDDDLPLHMKAKLTDKQKKQYLKKTSKKARRTINQEVSWIWKRLGAHRFEDEVLDEDLRVEFCKSKARADRWGEEVLLLGEEMRRVKRFFQYRSETWRQLGNDIDMALENHNDDQGAIREGLRAYASRQAKIFENMLDRCETTWKVFSIA